MAFLIGKDKMARKKTLPSEVVTSEAYVKDFFDMVVPSTIKFNVDHFVCGDSFRCVWAIKEYPPNTTDQAILSRFGDKEAVTLHMYTRFVDGLEQRKILQNASRKNKMLANSNDLEDSVIGEGNLCDVVELMNDLRRNREPLLHCAVFLELSANSLERLRELQADISMELTREKLSVDRLTLRQKEGFIACMPCGHNVFGTQFERVLPASAVANCYPFNYSGKTDPHGFYLGKDKYGTNIIVDFDRRSDDKTNANILILGNSGQGKSYLLKLILTNTRMSGKSVICLDAEQEYKDLTNNLGGCYVDLMSGQYIINPLEPKEWSDNTDDVDDDAPEAFRKATRLSQHISYLKDFFRVYKDFNDAQIDALEILLTRLYDKFGIHDNTDYEKLTAEDYRSLPLMPFIKKALEEERARQEEMQRVLRKSYNRKYLDYVCVDAMGDILKPQYVTEHFKVILERNGLKKIRFHDLRHSCASLMLANDISMKEIQEWLGHSNISTTANIYAHVDSESKRESARIIDKVLSKEEAV